MAAFSSILTRFSADSLMSTRLGDTVKVMQHSSAKERIIDQAIVAIGGRGKRLRDAGFEVPESKSFIMMFGQPLLYWCLRSLHMAGIRRLVLCGNEQRHLDSARILLDDQELDFEVSYVLDPGFGVHGLPWQARDLLDDACIFECGHSIMHPEHYRRLMEKKKGTDLVVSGFRPHPSNRRQPVYLRGGRVQVSSNTARNKHAVAHPFAIDANYVEALPSLDYNIEAIVRHYAEARRISYVMSSMPPEFDVLAELEASMGEHQQQYRQLLLGKK
jgi:choline kinase